MRARHRHFNQRHAGAGIVLDARYINQADNTAVSTWSDRSGNGFDAAQATPANQPTLQTAEVGGNPIVSFDGSDDNLTMSGAVAYLKNVGYGLMVAVVKDRTPTAGKTLHHVVYFSRGGSVAAFRLGLSSRVASNNFRVGARRLDGDAFTPADSANNGNYNILSALGNYSGGTTSVVVNNKTEATSNLPSGGGNTSNTDSDVVIIGATSGNTNDNAPIDVALLLAFNVALSDALRMRVHRSAALTYKIACN